MKEFLFSLLVQYKIRRIGYFSNISMLHTFSNNGDFEIFSLFCWYHELSGLENRGYAAWFKFCILLSRACDTEVKRVEDAVKLNRWRKRKHIFCFPLSVKKWQFVCKSMNTRPIFTILPICHQMNWEPFILLFINYLPFHLYQKDFAESQQLQNVWFHRHCLYFQKKSSFG